MSYFGCNVHGQVREAADLDLELDSGGELLGSSQIGYGASGAQAQPAASAQAGPGAAAAASGAGASAAAAAAQKLPAEELEEAEERGDVLGPGAPAGEAAAGAAASSADIEPVQSMSAALKETLAGKADEVPSGNVLAAVPADADISGAGAAEAV